MKIIILRHFNTQHLIKYFSAILECKQGSYVLTIASVGQQGDLAAISKIIAKYSSIASCITLMSIVKNLFVAHLLLYQPAQLPKRVQPL